MKKTIIAILVIVALAIIFNFTAKKDSEEKENDNYVPVFKSGTMETPSADNTAPKMETGDSGDVSAETAPNEKTFTVSGSNFSFSLGTITVDKGDRVTIVFKNAGGTHYLRIDEFDVTTPKIGDGEEASVTFVADKTGSFEYYCSVGTHRQMGMKGTLTVK